jgi:hypothetical protein
MMAKDSDDTKPTPEDVDRMLHEHERNNAAGQDMRKVPEARRPKGQEASKQVRFRKGESLWDRAGREIDAAEKDEDHGKV